MTATTENGRQRRTVMPRIVYTLWFMHLVAIGGALPVYEYVKIETVLVFAGILQMRQINISLYLHRFLTHSAFQMHLITQYILSGLAAGSMEGTAAEWKAGHKRHHKYEDTPKDTHSPFDGIIGLPPEQVTLRMRLRGWVHSYVGWMCYAESYIGAKKERNNDPVLQWQHTHYTKLMVSQVFIIPTLLGVWLEGDHVVLGVPYWFGGVIGFFMGVQIVVLGWSWTWIVNWAGHLFGPREDALATNFGDLARSRRIPYPIWMILRVLFILLMIPVSYFTAGELWHAKHHKAQRHWKLGREWWQNDPTAHVIDVMAFFGLIWDRKEPKDRTGPPNPDDMYQAA